MNEMNESTGHGVFFFKRDSKLLRVDSIHSSYGMYRNNMRLLSEAIFQEKDSHEIIK
jgi:hypothetical protein